VSGLPQIAAAGIVLFSGLVEWKRPQHRLQRAADYRSVHHSDSKLAIEWPFLVVVRLTRCTGPFATAICSVSNGMLSISSRWSVVVHCSSIAAN
jgi:hypothetical protein